MFEALASLPFDWDRSYVEEILRPCAIEDLYRRRVSLGHQAHQVIGLLLSYAAFARGLPTKSRPAAPRRELARQIRWVVGNLLVPVGFLVALVVVVVARWDDLQPAFEDPGRDLALIGCWSWWVTS